MQEQKLSSAVASGSTVAPRATNRGWRCFAGALAVLCGMIALNLAGCGGGGSDNGDDGVTLTVQVRDANSNLLPAITPDPNFTPPPTPDPTLGPTPPPVGPTPTPSPIPTAQPLTVRLFRSGFDRRVTFSNATEGARFTDVPPGIYSVQLFRGSSTTPIQAGPQIVVSRNDTAPQVAQVTLGQGTGQPPRFVSRATITGTALFTADQNTTSCTNSAPIANRAYLIRAFDLGQPGNPQVALRRVAANEDGRFVITDLPLRSVNGRAQGTTFRLQAVSDPNTDGPSFLGTGPSFSVEANTPSGTTINFDICARLTNGSVTNPTQNPTIAVQPTTGFTPIAPPGE